MKFYRVLFLYLLIFSYSSLSAAYTTYAKAQALGVDSQFFQAGSKIDQNTDANSTISDSFIYQSLDSSTPSGWSRRLQALGTAYAGPGVLKASASAGAFAISPLYSTSGLAEAGFTDSFTIRGSGSGPFIDLTLHYQVSGGLGGKAFAEGGLFLNRGGLFLDREQFISFSEAENSPRNFNCLGSTCSGTLTLRQVTVDTTYFIKAYLKVYAAAFEKNNLGNSSSADYSNTGRIFLSLSDPNYQLVTNSGFNYSPVPLPASIWLFGSALLGLVTRFGITKNTSRT
jgi:hypothetical protein